MRFWAISDRGEEPDHENLVVIAPILLQRAVFTAITDKSETRIKALGGQVLGDHRQVELFYPPRGMLNDRLDETLAKPGFSRIRAHIHAPKQALVAFLWTVQLPIAGDAEQCAGNERAKDLASGDPLLEP